MKQHRIRRLIAGSSIAVALLAGSGPAPAAAQVGSRGDSVSTTSAPALHVWRETGLSVLGSGLLLSAHLSPVRFRTVPTNGFDPLEIGLAADRGVVTDIRPGASRISDWTRNTAIAFPLLVGLTTSPGGQRLSGFGRTALVHAETMLISQGLTMLGKKLLGRARPYAYLPAMSRPKGSSYDVTEERTFVSMPSGHSSSAWTGAAMGMTEYLLNRPEAPWWERAGVGFIGGALAGATSALRVEAGQHFPSDVVAGAGMGIAVGVTVPLLHRGNRGLPSAKSWLQLTGGVLLGTALGAWAGQEF